MKRFFAKNLIILAVAIFLACVGSAQSRNRKSVLFFDLDAEKSMPAGEPFLIGMIKDANPDIAIFAGLKGRESLERISKKLPQYAFSFLAEAGDPEHLALISKISPSECRLERRSYKIKNDKTNTEDQVDVLRGFIVAKFADSNYEFTLIAAHLKDQEKHPLYNQFDMRRYEARQLRYVFDEIIKQKPDANVLLIGNFNDNCGMSPIKEIYARRYGNKKRLFDIRPVDDLRTSWTEWKQLDDLYERTSYALASFYMLPEVDREKTKIIKPERWKDFFVHRALFISFVCEEKEELSDSYLNTVYPNNIYSEVAAHFEKDKLIGEKPKRKSPAQKNSK